MDDAEELGYQAGLYGKPSSDCPYVRTQGSPTRVQAIAWMKGYRRGQREREIMEDEANGDLFRSKLR